MEKNILKIVFIFWAIFFTGYSLISFTTDFLKPTDEGRGTGMSSLISVGQEAIVDQPANVSFYSWEGYIVEQHNQDGTVVTHEPLNIDGDRYFVVSTNQPTTWLVTKSLGGIDNPLISVDAISDQQYPSLYIHRTWFKPLAQLFSWFQFPLVFIFMCLGVASFVCLHYVNKNK